MESKIHRLKVRNEILAARQLQKKKEQRYKDTAKDMKMSNGKWIFFLMKETVPFHQSKLTLQQEIQYVSVSAIFTATHEGRGYSRFAKFAKSRAAATAIAD